MAVASEENSYVIVGNGLRTLVVSFLAIVSFPFETLD